jgi:hypothetical protein
VRGVGGGNVSFSFRFCRAMRGFLATREPSVIYGSVVCSNHYAMAWNECLYCFLLHQGYAKDGVVTVAVPGLPCHNAWLSVHACLPACRTSSSFSEHLHRRCPWLCQLLREPQRFTPSRPPRRISLSPGTSLAVPLDLLLIRMA